MTFFRAYVVLFVPLLGAWTSAPIQPTASLTPVVAAPPAVPTTATTNATAAEVARTAALWQQARNRGSTRYQRDGHTVYCRGEAPLGTRFKETTYIPEEALARNLNHEAETQVELNRARTCAGSGCSAN